MTEIFIRQLLILPQKWLKGDDNMSEKLLNRFRTIARVVIEATTPFRVGSGNQSIETDSTVIKDINGLPYIPATTLAGIFRSSSKSGEEVFGYQSGDSGLGSKILFSDAKIMNASGEVIDTYSDAESDSFLKQYLHLPIRQHVRIGTKGAAVDGAKFDEEIVYKGSRFCFEVEYLADSIDDGTLEEVLSVLNMDSFRIGSGSRNGFGAFKLVQAKIRHLDLSLPEHLLSYSGKSSSLCYSSFWDDCEVITLDSRHDGDWTRYKLSLSPIDFILFGAGHGDLEGDADITPVREKIVTWENSQGIFKEVFIIPGTSIKGALAHRAAYHCNRSNSESVVDLYALQSFDHSVGKNVLVDLFGSEGEEKSRGNVMIPDVVIDGRLSETIMNHVVIDNYSGGAIDGLLFAEKAVYAAGTDIDLEILVKTDSVSQRSIDAFEKALDDLCEGLLPLGGGVNRGHGRFSGSYTK